MVFLSIQATNIFHTDKRISNHITGKIDFISKDYMLSTHVLDSQIAFLKVHCLVTLSHQIK